MNKRKIKAPVAGRPGERKSVLVGPKPTTSKQRNAAQSVVMTTDQLTSLLKYTSGSSHTLGSGRDDTQGVDSSSHTNQEQFTQPERQAPKYDNAQLPEEAPEFYEGENDALAMRGKDAAQRLTDQMMRQALQGAQFSQRTKNFLRSDLQNRDQVSLDQGNQFTQGLSFAPPLPQEEHQTSFLDEELLNSMRDIANSVSQVADQEMASYFQSMMKEQKKQKQRNERLNESMTTKPSHHRNPASLKDFETMSPTRMKSYSPLRGGSTALTKKLNYDVLQVEDNRADPLNSTFTAGEVRGNNSFKTYASRFSQAQQEYLNEPVYQRLYDTQTIYNQRLEGKKLLRYREETAELKDKPTIAPRSQKLAAKIKPIYHEGRINGVLGQKEQNIQRLKQDLDRQRIFEEQEVEQMLRKSEEGGKTLNQKDWNDKVDILVRRYYERKKQKEEIKSLQGKEHPYAPQINKQTKKIVQKVSKIEQQQTQERKGNIEDRLIKTLDDKHRKIKRLSQQMQPNFVPHLNQTSMKIMDEKVKTLMTTSDSLAKYVKPNEQELERKEKLKAKQRILEGQAKYQIQLQFEDEEIIEQSPSAQMSEIERRDTWIGDNAAHFVEVLEDQSKPSTLNSSIEIINRFKDVLN